MITLLKRALLVLLMLFVMQSSAQAGCIDDAASCIVNSVKAQYYAVSSVAEVLEFSATHPECVSAILAQDYVSLATMATVSGLAAGGVIGSSESSCKHDLYGKYAGQIAGTLASVVPNQTLKDIASGAVNQGIEGVMSAVPFPGALPSVGMQLTCGCAIAATGADMVDKIKKTAQFTAAAAKACAGFAGCVGETAWNALKDTGEVFYQVGECIGGPNDCGENAPMTEDSYYQQYWLKEANQYVEAQISNGKLTVSNGVGYVKGISPEEFVSTTWHECENYYINHRYSGGTLSTNDHAQRACDTMRDKFYAFTAATRGVRMDDEIFPKVAATLTTPYLQDCDVPKKNTPKPVDGKVDVSSSEQAQTYGSAQLSLSAECTKEIQFVIGKSPDGTLVAQADSALWETKNTYKANNFDIKGTYSKLMATGSKYDVKLKEIASTKKEKIAVSSAFNQKTTMINIAYEKQGNEKWIEYKAKCPASAKLLHSLNDAARGVCLNKTADYLGVSIAKGSDTNPVDDLGSITFANWKTLPVVYSAALDSFGKASEATQTLADARVTLSFATHQANLNAIAAASIAEAKATLKPIRQSQEQDYNNKLAHYTEVYTNAIKCELPLKEAITHTCEYSKTSLDEMFNAWQAPYLSFVQRKDALDKKIADASLPFTGKSESDSEFVKLLSDIDKATKRSPQVYKAAQSKPNAVIKVSKTYSSDIANPNTKSLKGAAMEDVKSKKAATLDQSGLKGNDTAPTLKSQSKEGNFSKGLESATPAQTKPTIRGMRAAPSMVAVIPNQPPQSKVSESKAPSPPVVTSIEESQQALKNSAPSAVVNSGNKAPSTNTLAVDSRQSTAQALPSPTQAVAGVNLSDATQQAAQQTMKSGGVGTGVAGAAASNGSNRVGIRTPVAQTAPPPAPTIVKDIPNQGVGLTNKPPEPPFDKLLYTHNAKQSLGNKWLGLCKNEICKTEINSLINARVSDVIQMVDAGQDLRIKANYDAAEAKMDAKYNPLMQAKVDASKPAAVEYSPPAPITQPVKQIKPLKKLSL